ncbi:MAG: N5-glutamine methyltransferase family protein, partial [Acidimicrobiales bacterium]
RGTVVRLVGGDWFDALPGELRGRIDVVVSNPPYVAETDPLPTEVADWEPVSALVAGPTGVEAIEAIVREAPRWLCPTGVLVVEIGETQADTVLALAAASSFDRAEIRPDLAGRPRVLMARQ